MTDNHNTLDDLVRVATASVRRCVVRGCNRPATCRVGFSSLCDACEKENRMAVGLRRAPDSDLAPAIRRLIASGILR